MPRDREGSVELQIIKKGQSRLMQMDDPILFLYAKGMDTRDICARVKNFYDTDVPLTIISKFTDAVL